MERLPTGREPDLPGKEAVASRTSPAAGIDASWPRKDGPPKPEESSRRVKDVRPYAGLFPPLDLLDGGHLLPGLLDLPPGAGQDLAVDRLPVEGVARVDQDGRLETELAVLLQVQREDPFPLLPVDAVRPHEDRPEGGLDHLVDVGAAQVPGDALLDLLQPPALEDPDPLQGGKHLEGFLLAARIGDPFHLPPDPPDVEFVVQEDGQVHVVVVVVHPGQGEHLSVIQFVHLALHDPPEDLLVVLGQCRDPLVVHSPAPLPYSFFRRGPASPRSVARFRMSISSSSSPSLGVSSTIGSSRNARWVRILRKASRPIFPSPMWKCRSTRLPKSVRESFRCHIRTSGRTARRSISASRFPHPSTLAISYPASNRCALSRQTATSGGAPAASSSLRICSIVRPMEFPCPAVFSTRAFPIHRVCCLEKIWMTSAPIVFPRPGAVATPPATETCAPRGGSLRPGFTSIFVRTGGIAGSSSCGAGVPWSSETPFRRHGRRSTPRR